MPQNNAALLAPIITAQTKLPPAIAQIPEKLKPTATLSNSNLEVMPFNKEIPAEKNHTSSKGTLAHSDASEIDSFKLNDKKYFVTIPDKANPSRINIYLRNEKGIMEIDKVIPLLDSNGKEFTEGTIDTEAIRFYEKDKKIFAIITSEGESLGYDKAKKDGSVPAEARTRDPKIYIAELLTDNNQASALKVTDEIKTPDRYKHQVKVDEKDPTKTIDLKGPRANGSFESVAIDEKGSKAFLITEFPLVQDGKMADTKNAGISRCLEIDIATGKTKEHSYHLDQIIPSNKAQTLIEQGNKIANEENGVVSIVKIPGKENQYLVMERSFLRITDKDDPKKTLHAENSIRIFKIDTTNASDVSKIEGLTNANSIAVKKELYLDFKDLDKLFSDKGINPDTKKLTAIDNFEGMKLNYNQEKANWELICVTDNNSNQKNQGGTQFLTISLK